jgi:hypothetical protein
MTTSRRDVLKILSLSIAGSQLPFDSFGSNAIHAVGTKGLEEISSSFNPQSGEWDISWPGRAAQYDLVYKSPPIDPLQGIALGNGEIGVLFWCEESKIIAVINKSDLWQDSESEKVNNWKPEEEDRSTTLRHACRVIIDFHFPVFSTLFLSGFNARLSLADGSMLLQGASPYGHLELKAFVEHSTGNIFFDLKTDFQEESPMDIAVERFGSRTFSHWYSLINRDASIGTAGTEAGFNDQGVYITQQLGNTRFAVGGTVIEHNGLPVSYTKENSHRSIISLGRNREKKVRLAFAVTSPDIDDVLGKLQNVLLMARGKGMDSARSSNESVWKSLWMRSFLDYGDLYLSNLWHLTIYYAIASQGGKYPGRFNNGLWTWSRDVQNWNFYFHWNQQQLYWPLNAAGFHQLVDPYLDYRFRSLPHAMEDARTYFKSDGAFISDVADRRGINSINESNNHTPVAEIALDFWRQYQYTGDKKFLKEKALPFILEAARFFVSLFVKEEDGLYHAREGTGYEGWIKLKDGLTEIVYANVLFSVALEALNVSGTDVPDTKKWKEILRHLAPVPLVKAGDACVERDGSLYKLKTGFFKGEDLSTDNITAAGWGIKEGKWLTVYNASEEGKYFGLKLLDGIFPTVASSAVFPSNFVGLAQKESNINLFEAVKSTGILYSPGITGWDPVPIVLARLGLKDELEKVLKIFPGRWQIYCNGWGHWGLEGEVNKDAEWFFRTNMVKDAATEEKFPLRVWPFRHMSMESMSVLASSMNESLLQSHDGIIRVAPAIPNNKLCRFTLHAIGGFVVSSEIKSGTVQWICIKSALGNTCRLEIPWENITAYSGAHKLTPVINKRIAEIETQPGEIIMIIPSGTDVRSWKTVPEKALENDNARYHESGKAQLGLPRMF